MNLKKVNLFDILVIIIIILAIFVGYRFLDYYIFQEENWMNITIEAKGVSSSVLELIEKGDIEEDLKGKKIAEILDYRVLDEYNDFEITKYDVLISARVFPEIVDDIEYYKDKPIRVGVEIPIQTDKYYFKGNIIELGDISLTGEYVYKEIDVRAKSLLNEVADKVDVGDKGFLTDKLLIEILDKKEKKAEIIELDNSGNAHIGADPTKKDLDLRLKVLCYEIDNRFFYKEYELVPGNNMPINIKDSSFWATIINT